MEQLFVDADTAGGGGGNGFPTGALAVLDLAGPTHMYMVHHHYLKVALNASEVLSQRLKNELSKERDPE